MEQLVLWHRALPASRDGLDDVVAMARWTETVAARWAAARGRTLAVLGSQVVAAFDLDALRDAVASSLTLLDEAQRMEGGPSVCIGGAVGELDAGPILRGHVLDRAALLAHRAGPGDIVLDPGAREHAGAHFLFGRSVDPGTGVPWTGQAIDRVYPERRLCLPLVQALHPFALPNTLPPSMAELRAAVGAPGSKWVVVRGGAAAGAEEWLEALAADQGAPLVLWIQAVPGALEPLGSLRLALLRRWGSPEGVFEAFGGIPAADTLAHVARGWPVARADVIRALQTLVATFADGSRRPWLVLHPFTSVDPATREVVALATIRAQADSLVVASVAPDTTLPKGLEQVIAADVTLPELTEAEAVGLLQQVFGEVDEDIPLRAATLGGTSPLGLLEAARTLIQRGDVVRVDDHFTWRRGPSDVAGHVDVASLLADRVSGLDADARRILEIVAVAPAGSSNALLWAAMERDTIEGAAVFDAVARLREGAFLVPSEPLRATSNALRQVVFETSKPERIAALQRIMADALAQGEDAEAFSAATRGFFLAESGSRHEGALALLKAGFSASKQGFVRAAMRLAAAAVQFDPSPEVQREATLLTQATPPPAPPRATSSPPPPNRPVVEASDLSGAHGMPPTGDLRRQAVEAILSGNFESADHTIDVAVAEGCRAEAADRLRAMAYLVRGDVQNAIVLLARARQGGLRSDGALIRHGIAETLVLVHTGQMEEALRTGLRALGAARALGDARGERAAMHAIAATFETLGKREQAKGLRAAASTR